MPDAVVSGFPGVFISAQAFIPTDCPREQKQ